MALPTRQSPWKHIESDDEIAFRDLQRIRRPDLSKQEFRDLFAVWRDHYRAQQVINDAERGARFDALCRQREELFAERAVAPPQHHDVLTAQLYAIGRALAELMPTSAAAALGEWVNSPSRAAS
jgi:hypothetical protein